MAKVVDNYKKFKVLEITRQEMMDKLTRYGCLGICDMCNRPTSVGYYVAVINQWMCEDCYNDFIKSVDRYEEDMRIEKRHEIAIFSPESYVKRIRMPVLQGPIHYDKYGGGKASWVREVWGLDEIRFYG